MEPGIVALRVHSIHVNRPGAQTASVGWAPGGVGYIWRYATPNAPPLITVSHIEVSQVVQDETNSVPLIAGKPTFVRVYVNCFGCTSPTNVTGVLRGYGPSGELSGSPLRPVNFSVVAAQSNWADQREHLTKTLNFTLPPIWTSGNVMLTASVNGANSSEAVTFQPAKTLRVAYVPIHYEPSGRPGCLTEPKMDKIAAAHQWAQEVLPIGSQIKIDVWPMMYWSSPLYDPPDCRQIGKSNDEWKSLVRTLEAKWLLYSGSNRPDYVFGWLPTDAFFRGAPG